MIEFSRVQIFVEKDACGGIPECRELFAVFLGASTQPFRILFSAKYVSHFRQGIGVGDIHTHQTRIREFHLMCLLVEIRIVKYRTIVDAGFSFSRPVLCRQGLPD